MTGATAARRGHQWRARGAAVAAATMLASLFSPAFASAAIPPTDEPGVTLRVFDTGALTKICDLKPAQTPNIDKIVSTLDLTTDAQFGMANNFLAQGLANLSVPTAGEYTFRLTSDDGSRLYIDGNQVIDHDGLHGDTSKDGAVTLTAGVHPLRVDYFDAGGGKVLKLLWRTPGSTTFVTVPNSVLSTEAGVTRVTAPGFKECEGATDVPGDGLPLNAVNPNYTLTNLRPAGFEPQITGIDWLPGNRMVVSTWGGNNGDLGDNKGEVYILDNVTGATSPSQVTYKKIADTLREPQGIKVVDGAIYVSEKDKLIKLVDTNNDEITDVKQTIATWSYSANFHEFAFGMLYEAGYFYINLSVAINLGGATTNPQPSTNRGTTMKINKDTGAIQYVAGGLRTPNGIGWGPEHGIFVTDNQGAWLPANKLIEIKQDQFNGHYTTPKGPFDDNEPTPPVLWIPHNEIGNSPSTPLWIEDGPYANQMYIGDVTYGGIQRGFLEKVDGAYQGAIFRMTQGLEAGITRISLGPDGAIYAGGLGAGGNWGQEGKLKWGLQKLTPVSGADVFDFLSMSVNETGFDLKYTEPLSDETIVGLADKYDVQQWSYTPTPAYGGPKIGEETLEVTGAVVSADKKSVKLTIEGLEPAHVVHIRSPRPFKSADGQSLWSSEAWYTLNSLPGYVAPLPDGGLFEAEEATLSGGTGIGTEHAGFTGSGYAEFQTLNNTATFNVNVDNAGEYKTTIRYANGPNPFAGAKKVTLYVNGAKLKQVSLPSTGTWKDWGTFVETLTLPAGQSTIGFKYETGDDGNINLDSINVYRTPTSNLIEAEASELIGGSKPDTEHAGYTGAGYVSGFQAVGAEVRFGVHVDAAGTYPTTLRYSAGPNPFAGAKKVSLYLNGAKVKQVLLPATATWKIWANHIESLNLRAGMNTVTWKYDTGDDGNINLDSLLLGTAGPNCGTVVPNDSFDGTALDKCRWTVILNENPAGYEVSGGALKIKALAGDITGDNPNAKNIILQQSPSTPWSIKTNLSLTGTDDYLQGGLVAYTGQSAYAKTVLINIPNQGWKVEFARRSGTDSQVVNSPLLPAGANTNIRLRLDSSNGTIRGFYSLDGTTWIQVGNGYPAGNVVSPQIGLAGYNGTGVEVASFSDFTIGAPEPVADTCVASTPEAGYTNLFDGTLASLDDWTMAGPGSFQRLEDCTLLTVGGLGLLWHEKVLNNYSLKLDWKMAGDDNAGVFVGFPDPGTDPWVAVDHGYEIQIDATDAVDRTTGAIYTFQAADIAARDAALKPVGQWNSYEIRVVGNVLTVILNGTVINTFTNPPGSGRNFANSHIGLQNHGDGDDVYFRNVQVRDLTAPAVTASVAPSAPNGDNGWYTSAVTASAAVQGTGFGTLTKDVRVDGGDWSSYTTPVATSADGAHTVAFRAAQDGLTSEVKQVTFKIDNTAPVTAPDVTGDGTVNVSLAAADATSGLAGSEYRIGAGAWTAYSAPFTFARANAATTVQFRSTDLAGNIEPTRSVVVPGTGGADPVASSTTLAVLTPEVLAGGVVKVKATVASTGTVGADMVVFYANGVLVGGGKLSSGSVTADLTLKAGRHTLTAEYLGNGSVDPSTSTEQTVAVYFADKQPGSQFYEEILWLAASGISTGQTPTTFAPGQSVSRQAMAAFLFRLANPDAPKPTCTTAPFTDVPAASAFCGEIKWLSDEGITTGQDGKFQPTQAVSRQAMAAFLYRLSTQN